MSPSANISVEGMAGNARCVEGGMNVLTYMGSWRLGHLPWWADLLIGLKQDADGIWLAPSGARVAWFQDPDGHVLSLTQFP